MRLRSIDLLRAVAALLVVLRHADDRFKVGSIGVDLFFVISGFVMVGASKGRTPLQFLRARARRIYPTYWAALLPWIAMAAIGGSLNSAQLSASILIFPAWIGFDSGMLGVSWTLVYELLFYSAFALAIYLGSPRLPLLLFIAALALRPFWQNPFVAVVGSPIIIEFLFGVLIAQIPRNAAIGAGMLGLALIWLFLFPNSSLEDFRIAQSYSPGIQRVALWGVPAAMVVYALVSNERRMPGGPLLTLGAASYSIYLTHTFVILNMQQPWPLEVLLATTVGVMFWWLVELPLTSRPKQTSERRIEPAVAAITRNSLRDP